MKMIFAIALGGAFGAIARHYLAASVMRWASGDFPWGIFAVNVIGSFLMGIVIIVLSTLAEPMPTLRAFLAVGVLGAFTTFSTFSLDVVLLIERGQMIQAMGYALGSVVLAVVALMIGMALGRMVVPG